MGAARREAELMETENIRLTAELDRLIALSITRVSIACPLDDGEKGRREWDVSYVTLGRSFPTFSAARAYILQRIKWEQP